MEVQSSTTKDVLEGFVTGVLAASVIIYGFQTRMEYPPFLLHMINHPWMIVVAIVLGLVMLDKSPHIGALLLLWILAFVIDIALFSRVELRNTHKSSASPSPIYSHEVRSAANAAPFEEESLNLQKTKDGSVSYGAIDAGVSLNSLQLPVPNYPLFHIDPQDVRGGAAPLDPSAYELNHLL